jgi:hypothetical protein
MSDIRIAGTTLHVEMSVWDQIWSIHTAFAIPLANVTGAHTQKPPGFFEAARLLGTGAAPLKEAGTFRYHGEMVFFNFSGREENVLVIDLLPGASPYRHLFVHVDDPLADAQRITAALAAG